VIFATGHRRAGEHTDWAATAAPGTTLALYMGVSSAAALQAALMEGGWPEAAPVEVISKAQTPEQRILRGRLSDLGRLCLTEAELNPAILFVRWPATLAQPAAASLGR